MTDQPVSNARRVGFTALAVAAFWVLAWQAYWFGAGHEFLGRGSDLIRMGFEDGRDGFVNKFRHAIAGSALVVVPTVFLMLSAGNSLLTWRKLYLACSGLLMASGAGLTSWLGQADSHWRRITELSFEDFGVDCFQPSGLRPQEVSWAWLMLLVFMASILVVVCAWRQAVRDAALVVDEDEAG